MISLKKGKRKHGIKSGEAHGYWQSYSDLMAALLLMFILITMAILIKSTNDYNKKLKEQELAQQQILEQNEAMKKQQELLEEQEKKINDLIGVKAEIIEQLSVAFNDVDLKVTIDSKTGAIAFASSVLFDYNQSDIKESGEEFLNQFIPIYMKSILNDRFKDDISEIMIEGYTDNVGDYIYNLELSQKRAFSVSKYCLDNPNLLETEEDYVNLKNILTTNGKSMSNLIYKENGEVDSDASRRVEFKFRLKDDEMINELKEILESNKSGD